SHCLAARRFARSLPPAPAVRSRLHWCGNGCPEIMFADVAQEALMPFDCAPIIDAPKSMPALDGDVLDFGTKSPNVIIARPIPAWHAIRRPECVADTLAVLTMARALLADEQRWCRGSFARGWLDIPVPVRSVFVSRFCMLGAVMRAGRWLGLPTEDAANALEWQTRRPVQYWNDDPARMHAEVIAAFDGAIAALEETTL